ncbi:3-keto-disaccharide hydrolase [Streptomyces sp. NPDC004752]
MTASARPSRRTFLAAGSLAAAALISLGTGPAAAAAGTTYYVDPASGSDNNAGTSEGTAWRTLTKVNTVTFAPGDRILLKAGSIFTDQCLDLKGNGTAAAPIAVDQYGTGVRPVINFGNTAVDGEGFGVRLKNVSYWDVANLEITSGQFATDMRRHGVLVVGEGSGAGAFAHIHLSNLYIHDIFGTDRRTGGINFHARGSHTDPESTWSDVLIDGNTVSNVADTGIQTMTDAFFNSSWTHPGFTGVIIRNNYVEKIHRDGILVRSARGPLVEHNTTSKIGGSTTAGSAVLAYLDPTSFIGGQWSYYCTDGVFQYNEAFETKRLGGDGQPWNFDQMVSRSVYQYNYSHNNDGGTLLAMETSNENTFRYNISQDDLDLSNGTFHVLSTGKLYAYNNVIYRSQTQNTPLTGAADGTTGMAYYTNNIFYNHGTGGYTSSGNATYSHNLFYGANSDQAPDPFRLTGDPMFISPGTATGRATADGYKLKSGSPAIGSGIAVSDNGGKDFFGGTLYRGAPDRGAHETAGTAPTVLFSDDFEDGNAQGWVTSGGTWSVITDSTHVYDQSGTSGEILAGAGSDKWADYTLSARVKLVSTGGNVGVLFRYIDASNFYMFRLNDTTDAVELHKRIAGTLTLVASTPLAVVPGQFTTLKTTVVGNTITGYVDGVQRISWTNPATELTTGKIGLRMHGTAARFDDIVVTS